MHGSFTRFIRNYRVGLNYIFALTSKAVVATVNGVVYKLYNAAPARLVPKIAIVGNV